MWFNIIITQLLKSGITGLIGQLGLVRVLIVLTLGVEDVIGQSVQQLLSQARVLSTHHVWPENGSLSTGTELHLHVLKLRL